MARCSWTSCCANPFATLLAEARHFLIDPSWPSRSMSFRTPWLVLIPYGLIVLSIVGGTQCSGAGHRGAEEL